MFNSFHLQSKCCQNYIILIPSLSCFNRSVVSIIPLLTGVSSKCFHIAKLIFFSFHFQPKCYRNWSLSFLVHLVSTGVLACTSRPLFSSFIALQTPKFTWCSLFSVYYGVLSIHLSLLCHFFRFVQPRKVLWFHTFVIEAISFTSSLHLPLLSGAILDLGTRSSCSGGVL